jgi:hypothetical protein
VNVTRRAEQTWRNHTGPIGLILITLEEHADGQTSEIQSDSIRPDVAINVHAETYHWFMLGVMWMAIHLAVRLVFLVLVLWFWTSAGFLAALIVALSVLGAGIYAMTRGLAHSTETDNPSALGSRIAQPR